MFLETEDDLAKKAEHKIIIKAVPCFPIDLVMKTQSDTA